MNPLTPKPPSAETDSRAIIINVDYVIFVQFIAVLTAINSLLMIILKEAHPRSIAVYMWWIGTIFLLLEILVRLITTRGRQQPLMGDRGWIDVIGSLPIPFITLLRPWRVSMILRKVKDNTFREIQHSIVIQRARSTIIGILMAAILVLEVGSIMILRAEAGVAEANIHTAEDALWWSIVSMATVGYGDKYPVTTHGRLIGTIMIIAGVALFTSLTSFLAHWFIVRRPILGSRDGSSSNPTRVQQVEAVKNLLDEVASDPDDQRADAILNAITVILESSLKRD